MVLELTAETFEEEVLKAEMPVLVDCFADWCGPCKMMAPLFDELAAKYAGQVKFCKINIDDNLDAVKPYRVMSIPNFLGFKDGELKTSAVGMQDMAKFESLIAELL